MGFGEIRDISQRKVIFSSIVVVVHSDIIITDITSPEQACPTGGYERAFLRPSEPDTMVRVRRQQDDNA